ncbi:MAG: GNAT family N-acetyltransferase [Rhodoblastus sp.]|nr:GNAT family N-acetyltransferase [Rhodoblastus sp.]
MKDIDISEQATPGALARLIEMHALYYTREWGFGAFFEARVAREAGEFVASPPRADSRLWFARVGDHVMGSIAIDGRHAATEGAHLRWFILDISLRGGGVGARLLDTALVFCRAQGFSGVYLSTFAGLDAARRLYESRGFRLVAEAEAESWGVRVREQRFELDFRAA